MTEDALMTPDEIETHNPLTSRKLWLAVATVASATALVWFGRIADGVYSAVVIAAVGGYLTANVTQKALLK